MTEPPQSYGSPARGVSLGDVSHAADALLRAGERPTVERIRAAIGRGSPNTVGPLLDTWWKRLSARLDSGPAALHRLPESVAHVAEALWLQALDEGRQRARLELKSTQRVATEKEQSLEVRSHVLSLREEELDSRLRDRQSTIGELNLQLRELRLLLRKEQATREAQSRRITALEVELSAQKQPPVKSARPQTPPTPANPNRRDPQRTPKLRKAAPGKRAQAGKRR